MHRWYQRIDRWTNVPMIVLSLAVIPLVFAPAMDLPSSVRQWVKVADWVIWGVFAVEIAIMTYLAPDRLRHLRRRWYELPVLLMPVLDGIGVLRALRILRSARVVRAIRATRAGAYLLRFQRPLRFLLESHGLHYVLAVGAVLYFAAIALITRFERESHGAGGEAYRDWLVWGLTAITSLDFKLDHPATTEGRVVAVFVALLGFALLSIITANIAALLLHSQDTDSKKLDEIIDRLDRMEAAARDSSLRSE
jgi:voltage-gated potassium channel